MRIPGPLQRDIDVITHQLDEMAFIPSIEQIQRLEEALHHIYEMTERDHDVFKAGSRLLLDARQYHSGRKYPEDVVDDELWKAAEERMDAARRSLDAFKSALERCRPSAQAKAQGHAW